MATSLQKATALIDEMLDSPESAVEDLPPFFQGMARMGLPMLPNFLPETAEEFDELLDRAQAFITALRSDAELPA